MNIQIINGPSRHSIEQRREKVFAQLLDQIIAKAETEKGKLNGEMKPMALTKAEIRQLAEKTRAHLEKMGWWLPGSGIR